VTVGMNRDRARAVRGSDGFLPRPCRQRGIPAGGGKTAKAQDVLDRLPAPARRPIGAGVVVEPKPPRSRTPAAHPTPPGRHPPHAAASRYWLPAGAPSASTYAEPGNVATPPCGSSSCQHGGGSSQVGAHHQSTVASRRSIATVCPLPITRAVPRSGADRDIG
jgi:hypothetical protein